MLFPRLTESSAAELTGSGPGWPNILATHQWPAAVRGQDQLSMLHRYSSRGKWIPWRHQTSFFFDCRNNITPKIKWHFSLYHKSIRNWPLEYRPRSRLGLQHSFCCKFDFVSRSRLHDIAADRGVNMRTCTVLTWELLLIIVLWCSFSIEYTLYLQFIRNISYPLKKLKIKNSMCTP